MRFRNASQVRVLHDLFNRGENREFFRTFVFENFADFAMNWFISDQDIDNMRRSIDPSGGHEVLGSEGPAATPASDAELAPGANQTAIRKVRAIIEGQNFRTKADLKRWWDTPDLDDREPESPEGADGHVVDVTLAGSG